MNIKELKIEADGNDMFVVVDGVKIAKRGRPGKPHAKAWISLEPGWESKSPTKPLPRECISANL
jgi:hypothetical protein